MILSNGEKILKSESHISYYRFIPTTDESISNNQHKRKLDFGKKRGEKKRKEKKNAQDVFRPWYYRLQWISAFGCFKSVSARFHHVYGQILQILTWIDANSSAPAYFCLISTDFVRSSAELFCKLFWDYNIPRRNFFYHNQNLVIDFVEKQISFAWAAATHTRLRIYLCIKHAQINGKTTSDWLCNKMKSKFFHIRWNPII